MSEAPDDLTGLSALEPPTATRRRRRWALWGTLAVVALGAGAVAVLGPDDGDPPKLPVALGAAPAEGRASAAPMAAADSMLAFVHYVAGDDLPALGGSGPAYRVHGPDEAAVRQLADAFGLAHDAPLSHSDGTWSVGPSEGPTVQVDEGTGAWWYQGSLTERGVSADGSSGSASGGATAPECPPTASCVVADGGTATSTGVLDEPACPPATEVKCGFPVPTTVVAAPPADLPSRDEAKAIALDRFRAAGADVDGAAVRVDGPYDGWQVTFDPRLDGLPLSGATWSAAIGPKGVVLGASGVLATYEHLGDYPTLDTSKAIDRLNDGSAWGGAGYAARDEVAPAIGCAVPDVPITTIPPETTELVDPATGAGSSPAGGATELACPAVAPAEPVETVLHGAERILVVLMASDGSNDQYVVPGYRLTGDDGAIVEVPSVDDDSLLPTTTVPVDGTDTTASIQCQPMPPDAVDVCILPDGGTTDGGPAIVNPEPGSTPPSPPTTPIPPVPAR